MTADHSIKITAYDIALNLFCLLVFVPNMFFPDSLLMKRVACVGIASVISYVMACQLYFNAHVAGKREAMRRYEVATEWLQWVQFIIVFAMLANIGFF